MASFFKNEVKRPFTYPAIQERKRDPNRTVWIVIACILIATFLIATFLNR